MSISQVTTEPELVERSTKLEEVLSNGNFIDYCRQRADETEDQHGRYVWYFLKANFEADPHAEMLNLLGKQVLYIERFCYYFEINTFYNWSFILRLYLSCKKLSFGRLGYNIEDMRGKFNKFIEKNSDIDELSGKLADLVSII